MTENFWTKAYLEQVMAENVRLKERLVKADEESAVDRAICAGWRSRVEYLNRELSALEIANTAANARIKEMESLARSSG